MNKETIQSITKPSDNIKIPPYRVVSENFKPSKKYSFDNKEERVNSSKAKILDEFIQKINDINSSNDVFYDSLEDLINKYYEIDLLQDENY